MLQFSANLSFLYTELPFAERFKMAKADGFSAVEFLFPYAYPLADLKTWLSSNDLKLVLFNAPAGGESAEEIELAWQQGKRGSACDPSQRSAFRFGLLKALEFAVELGNPLVHAMVGLRNFSYSWHQCQETLLENLMWASQQAQSNNKILSIEAISQRMMAHFFLQTQEHAHEIVKLIDSPHLRVQMDLFHCQVQEGDLSHHIAKYFPQGKIAHLQIADPPLRHEPGSGEINWNFIFAQLNQLIQEQQWSGYIGCEYHPSQVGCTSASLKWLHQLKQQDCLVNGS